MPTRAAIYYAIAAGIGAAGASALAATGGVALFEAQTRAHLESTLESADSWLSIAVDGTTVILSGEAPDVAARRAALTRLGAVRNGLVMIDATSSGTGATAPQDATKPAPLADVALRILLNGDEITLIGEIPRPSGDDPLAPLTGRRGAAVTDMTLPAEGRVPEAWAPALALALDAAGALHRGQVSVRPGEVVIDGTVAEPGARDNALARLAAERPRGTRLLARLSAPREVIAPFPFTARLQADGTLLVEDCAAPDDAAAAAIRARAAELGTEIDCRIGLGAPSEAWPEAVLAALDTLSGLGGGSLEMADSDVRLTGPAGLAPARFADRAEALTAALPPAYALTATLPPPDRERGPADVQPPQFSAVRSEDGAVRMRGDLFADKLQEQALVLAEAHFGFDTVVDETEPRADLPAGWSARVVAGLEALGRLQHGQLEITEDEIFVTGTSASEKVEDEVRAVLAARLPDDAATRLELFVSEDLSVANSIALPGELCAEQISLMLEGDQILFPPGETGISEESLPSIDRIAEVLKKCPGARFEIEGHTDSQGRESSNMALSQTRAEAVLAALLERGVDMVFLYATGYGETRPIADNGTEEGRAQNRRIAFSLRTEQDDAADVPVSDAGDGSVMAEGAAQAPGDDTVTTRASAGPTPIVESTTAETADGDVARTALSVADETLDGSGDEADADEQAAGAGDTDPDGISDHSEFHAAAGPDATTDETPDETPDAEAETGTEADAPTDTDEAAHDTGDVGPGRPRARPEDLPAVD
ncbi:OmpA family protein [Rhodobacteraceae bacterium 2CG4]|uniref:OmpA family protein n=1 Tax=Halovulum marinum TaxID=2662447 RepID=A0A6L5Z5D9_9RHOB|nr:OmpA family protein [Halovulum marinum]MSU91315.1 OmpA family protein [Halovulum marinum]